MIGKAIGRLLLLVPLMLAAQPTQAATSSWTESDGGRMRLVALSQPRNDQIVALLQIEPKPGWKTYWRNPGDAGMPPELDFSASSNLVLRSVAFPVPEFGQDDGGRFIGYHGAASLVLTFDRPDAGQQSRLDLNALIGICDKICLPFQASFSVPLTTGVPEGEEFMAVQLAEAALPEKPSADFSVKSAGFSTDGKWLEAEIALPSPEKPEIAAVAPRGVSLGHMDVDVGTGNVASVRIAVIRLDKAYAGGPLTLLVRSGSRAMESTLVLP